MCVCRFGMEIHDQGISLDKHLRQKSDECRWPFGRELLVLAASKYWKGLGGSWVYLATTVLLPLCSRVSQALLLSRISLHPPPHGKLTHPPLTPNRNQTLHSTAQHSFPTILNPTPSHGQINLWPLTYTKCTRQQSNNCTGARLLTHTTRIVPSITKWQPALTSN